MADTFMIGAKISIAMGTFNGVRFIQDQLESIAQQSLMPYELVITDDGSSDRTLDIITEYSRGAPFPVHLHRNETRLGYADNFLKAASLCRGDLIAFSDQDDVWLINKLARCADAFKDGSVMLAVHTGKVVDKDLKPAGWLFPKIDQDAVTLPLHKGPGRGLSGFAMVFRSNMPLLFSSPRPWSAQDRVAPMIHDQWVTFLARVFGHTVYIREPLVLYRRHGTTATKPMQSSLTRSLRGSLSAAAAAYSSLAQLNGHWADYLEQALLTLSDEQRLMAKKGADYYRGIEQILLSRSNIYQSDKKVSLRILSLLRLLAQGGYGPQQRGGLGLRALLKDASVGVLGINHWV